MRKETVRELTQCSVLILLPETNTPALSSIERHTPLSPKSIFSSQAPLPKQSPLPNPVVVHQERFQPPQQREPVQLADLVVREIDGIKLVQSGPQVLNNWDFIAWREREQGRD